VGSNEDIYQLCYSSTPYPVSVLKNLMVVSPCSLSRDTWVLAHPFREWGKIFCSGRARRKKNPEGMLDLTYSRKKEFGFRK
jgi:hypothetical protein